MEQPVYARMRLLISIAVSSVFFQIPFKQASSFGWRVGVSWHVRNGQCPFVGSQWLGVGDVLWSIHWREGCGDGHLMVIQCNAWRQIILTVEARSELLMRQCEIRFCSNCHLRTCFE